MLACWRTALTAESVLTIFITAARGNICADADSRLCEAELQNYLFNIPDYLPVSSINFGVQQNELGSLKFAFVASELYSRAVNNFGSLRSFLKENGARCPAVPGIPDSRGARILFPQSRAYVALRSRSSICVSGVAPYVEIGTYRIPKQRGRCRPVHIACVLQFLISNFGFAPLHLQYESKKLLDEIDTQLRKQQAVNARLLDSAWLAKTTLALGVPGKEAALRAEIEAGMKAALAKAQDDAKAAQWLPDVKLPHTDALQTAKAKTAAGTSMNVAEAAVAAATPASPVPVAAASPAQAAPISQPSPTLPKRGLI